MNSEIIKEYHGYKVSSFGYVISKLKGTKLIAGDSQSKGGNYAKLNLRINNKSVNIYIHRLIAEMFLGDVRGMQVDHIDGDIRNNHISNLRIGSQIDNLNNRWCKRNNKYYAKVDMNKQYFKTRGY